MQIATNEVADRADQDAEQERNTPPPALDLFRTQTQGDTGTEARTEQHSEADTGLNPAGVVSLLALWRLLGEIGSSRTHFTARRNTLQQTSKDNDARCQKTCLFVGRRQANHGGADTHQNDGERQRTLATITIRVDTNQNATYGPD
ncbi:hypothetical protein D3C76_1115800 [compost metagenome]